MGTVIIGTGGLAKEIWGMLTDMKIEVEGFIAKKSSVGLFCGLPILGDDLWVLENKGMSLVIANGNPTVRKQLIDLYYNSPHTFPRYVHPQNALFGNITYKGGGITIMPMCVIQHDVVIGRFTHINMGCTIGHDTKIGNGCVINHNAGISGGVTIGNHVLIGAGATIIENLKIGDGAIVGAGAVVTKDVPEGETWVGVPAKKLSKIQVHPYSEV